MRKKNPPLLFCCFCFYRCGNGTRTERVFRCWESDRVTQREKKSRHRGADNDACVREEGFQISEKMRSQWGKREREREKKGRQPRAAGRWDMVGKQDPSQWRRIIDGKEGGLGGISRMRGWSWRSSKLRTNATALECLQELARKSSADVCCFLQSVKTSFIPQPRVSVSHKSTYA